MKNDKSPKNLKIQKHPNASNCFRMRLNASQWVRMDPNGSEHVRKPRKTRESFEKRREHFEKLRERFRNNFFHGVAHLCDGVISGTKKAPKLNFLGKFCRQKSLLKFWPMGGQKKV